MYFETEMAYRSEGQDAGRSYQVAFGLNRNVQESYYLMTDILSSSLPLSYYFLLSNLNNLFYCVAIKFKYNAH